MGEGGVCPEIGGWNESSPEIGGTLSSVPDLGGGGGLQGRKCPRKGGGGVRNFGSPEMGGGGCFQREGMSIRVPQIILSGGAGTVVQL